MVDEPDSDHPASFDAEIQERLGQLLQAWDAHRQSTQVVLSSRSEDFLDCDAYREIVNLGRPALPYIVEEMRRGNNLLFLVVMDITALTPSHLEKELGLSWKANVSDLYLLWWDREGKDASWVNRGNTDGGKTEAEQQTSSLWLKDLAAFKPDK